MRDSRETGARMRDQDPTPPPLLPPPPSPPPLKTLFKISWDVANTEEKLQQESQKFDHL